jgi:hypothetical protein
MKIGLTVQQNSNSFNHEHVAFIFLGSMCTYGFNWHLNRLRELDVTKWCIYCIFKLGTENKSSVIENKHIYLYMKFYNNQSFHRHLVYVYFQLFILFSLVLIAYSSNLTPYCIFKVAKSLGGDCTWL